MADIGAMLREARMHARIDVSEIEARTKIRAKYLRALENEEWRLLPGPTFIRSFLRTYADALGLDGKAIVEEYRLHHERPGESDRFEHVQQPLVPTPPRPPARQASRGVSRTTSRTASRSHPGERPNGGGSRAYMVLVGAIVLLIVVLIVALISNNGGGPKKPAASTSAKHHAHKKAASHKAAVHKHSKPPAASDLVTLALTPTAPVWVCLEGAEHNKVIPGVTLEPGETVVHRSKHFEITLGNSELTITVDGKALTVAPAAGAANYAITSAGLTPITTGPECA